MPAVQKSNSEYERGDIALGAVKPKSEYERGDIAFGAVKPKNEYETSQTRVLGLGVTTRQS